MSQLDKLDQMPVVNERDVALSLILDYGQDVEPLLVMARSLSYGVDPARVMVLLKLAQVKVTWNE